MVRGRDERNQWRIGIDLFPVPMATMAATNDEYCCFFKDRLRTMPARIKIAPCIFDACVIAGMEAIMRRTARR